jgi:hypothetical protein
VPQDDETESMASHFDGPAADAVQRKSSARSLASTVSTTQGPSSNVPPSLSDSRCSSPAPTPSSRAPVVIRRTAVDDIATPAPSHFTAVAHAASNWVYAGSSSLQDVLQNPDRVSSSIQDSASVLVASVADQQKEQQQQQQHVGPDDVGRSRSASLLSNTASSSLAPLVSGESGGAILSRPPSPATTPKPKEKSVSYISSTLGRAFGAFGSSSSSSGAADGGGGKAKGGKLKSKRQPNLTLPKLDKEHVFSSDAQQQPQQQTQPTNVAPASRSVSASVAATVELEDMVAPESKPPAFNVAATKIDGEPLVDRFGFCLDARSGLGLLKEARRRQELAKENRSIPPAGDGGGGGGDEAAGPDQKPVVDEITTESEPKREEQGEGADDEANESTETASVIITVSSDDEVPEGGSIAVNEESEATNGDSTTATTPPAAPTIKQPPTSLTRRSPQATPTTSLTVFAPEPDPPAEEPSSSSAPANEATMTTTGNNASSGAVGAGPQSVRRLLAQLSDIDVSIEKAQLEAWDVFLMRRRVQLGSLASGDTDDWSDNIIGVARMGTSGKAGRDDWKAFKKLVRGGVPPSYRPKIWAECSGATEIREPGAYGDLLSQHEGMQSLCLSQIELE